MCPQSLMGKNVLNLFIDLYSQLSTLKFALAKRRKENLCSEMLVILQFFLTIVMLQKVALNIVFCESPLIIYLIVFIVKSWQLVKVYPKQRKRLLWKLWHRDITKLWISYFLVHKRFYYKFFLLNIVRTLLKFYPLDWNFCLNIGQAYFKRIISSLIHSVRSTIGFVTHFWFLAY